MIAELTLVPFGKVYPERQCNSYRSWIHRTRAVNHGKCVFIVAEIFKGVPCHVHCAALLGGKFFQTPIETRSDNVIWCQYSCVHFCFAVFYIVDILTVTVKVVLIERTTVFQHCKSGYFGVIEGIVLHAQAVFDYIDLFSECDNCFTVLYLTHSEQTRQTASRAYRFLV